MDFLLSAVHTPVTVPFRRLSFIRYHLGKWSSCRASGDCLTTLADADADELSLVRQTMGHRCRPRPAG